MIANSKQHAFLAFYVFVHLLVFAVKFNYHLSRSAAGDTVLAVRVSYALSKASGLLLHLDVAVVLFPVCHNVTQLLRQTFLARFLSLGSPISMHEMVAWSLVVFSWVHVATQWALLARLAAKQEAGFKGYLVNNFMAGEGWSGHVMLILLMLIALTSLNKARQTSLLRSWAIHQLFIPFFVLWCAHEIFVHHRTSEASWATNGNFWQYWIFGGVAYLVETILKEIRGSKKLFVSKIIQHPSQVVEIQIKKQSFTAKIGQSINICFPEVSAIHYNSFILTSAPEEDYLSVHVPCIDKNSMAIGSSVGCRFGDSAAKEGSSAVVGLDFESLAMDAPPALRKLLPRVFIDGPFGSVHDNIFKFETVVLVGAGKGVTPFASILKSIWYHINYPRQTIQLSKVYFFWICRDFDSFEWFKSLILAIEAQDLDDRIEIHTVRNQAIYSDDADEVEQHFSGLQQGTKPGRPDWDDILTSLRRIHAASDIGVFHAGPRRLADDLRIKCKKYSDKDSKFAWKENQF
ncbi:MAG: hypothetical protein Q9217_004221 [Psora testacea]